MRTRSLIAVLAGAILLLLLGGCYHYSTADRGSLSAGDEVVLTVADGSSASSAADGTPKSRKTVEGRVVSIGDSSIAVRTSRPAADPFVAGGSVVDTLRFGARRIEAIRKKQLKTATTAAVGGGVALGVGVASVLLLESAGGGGGSPGDGGDGINRVQLRIP